MSAKIRQAIIRDNQERRASDTMTTTKTKHTAGIRVDNIEDARLIAAAPALLEALERAVLNMAQHQVNENNQRFGETLEIARAALALATGGAE